MKVTLGLIRRLAIRAPNPELFHFEAAVSGKDAVRALQKLGSLLERIEDSHYILIKSGHPHAIPVPVHGSRALPKGTLASIIRLARVSKKQFFATVR